MISMGPLVLVLENSLSDTAALSFHLHRAGLDEGVTWATNREEFTSMIRGRFDVVVLQFHSVDPGAGEALRLLREHHKDLPVVFFGGEQVEQDSEAAEMGGVAAWVMSDKLEQLAPTIVRVHMEQQLRIEKSRAARLHGVWENSTDAIRLTNREGTIIAVNPAFCRLVEMREEDLVGKPFTVTLDANYDPQTMIDGHIRRFDRDESIHGREWRLRFWNGKEIEVELTVVRIGLRDGDRVILTMIRDISGKKSLEAKMLRSQRLESIGALAGGVAHDFNNILAPIFMAASMLRMKLSEADFERTLKTIEESAQRGSDMVRRLLAFARGIEGKRVPVDPVLIIQEVVRIVEQSFPRNIRLRTSIASDVRAVEADATQIHQVLLNLCVNARDAMPSGGRLLIEARNADLESENLPGSPHARSGRFVLLVVEDNGVGMNPELVQQIFEPFFSTKVAHGSSGLGLSTSLGIVRSHGGFIVVSSEPGAGARFEVYLPVAETLPAAEDDVGQPSQVTTGNGDAILVVDDEDAVRQVACKLLTRCGYRAIGVKSGKEALMTLKEREDIGLLLTDIVMPQMDGIQLLRELRQSLPKLPAIAMTGNMDQSYAAQLKQVGVTQVVEKPFNAQRLLDAIQREKSP